jgi:putative transposase
MPIRSTPRQIPRIYEFIKSQQKFHNIKMMCELLGVTRSGYYAWLKKPISNRTHENARLLRLIRASFAESHGIYGSPRVFLDLRESGETCSKHLVARLMRVNNIRAARGMEHDATRIPNPPSRYPTSCRGSSRLPDQILPGSQI